MLRTTHFMLGLVLGATMLALILKLGELPARDEAPVEWFDLISGFQCHAAETRHVFFMEHHENEAPAGMYGERALAQFAPPALTAEGFVIVAAGPGGGADGVVLRLSAVGAPAYHTGPAAGWRNDGSFLHARLSELQLDTPPRFTAPGQTRSRIEAPPGSVLDHIRKGGGVLTVDLLAGTSSAISQTAVVLCEEPPPGMGLAMSIQASVDDSGAGITLLGCHHERQDLPQCDPLRGNARCDAHLPLLCFSDSNLPAPSIPESAFPWTQALDFFWSGGQIAAIPDVRGDGLGTVSEANALCETEFGAGWRVASYHESARSNNFAAYGQLAEPHRLHWLDIKDQPYATCWQRQAARSSEVEPTESP